MKKSILALTLLLGGLSISSAAEINTETSLEETVVESTASCEEAAFEAADAVFDATGDGFLAAETFRTVELACELAILRGTNRRGGDTEG